MRPPLGKEKRLIHRRDKSDVVPVIVVIEFCISVMFSRIVFAKIQNMTLIPAFLTFHSLC
jgi:hypothetical protein